MKYFTIFDNNGKIIDKGKTTLSTKQILDFFEMSSAIEKPCKFSKSYKMFYTKSETIFIR